MKIDIERFRQYLEDTNKSRNTVEMYMFSIRQFVRLHGEFTKANATAYKGWLIGRYKPKTVNTRLMALNVYAEKVLKRLSLKVGYVREQQKPFLENVISDADYEYFKASLLKSGNARDRFYYFVIRFLAATGARISEFIQFKAEHVRAGHVDIYGKGGKVRRVYFPKSLREDALAWLGETGRASGFLWTGRSGERLTQRGIAQQLGLRAAVQDPGGGRLPALVPAPLREELPGEVQRHHAAGGPDGARVDRDDAHLPEADGRGAARGRGQGHHLVKEEGR